MQTPEIEKIRNVAIIAHVDHGKTTLVDGILKQTHVFRDNEAEMKQTTILDSNDLERERGITILAKNTAVNWKGYKINILDTPGHSDFSGEVERVLNMADGCLLIVDAAEGVLSQTRYVLSLALEIGLKPIVVINKIDRKDQRADEVKGEIDDLFLELSVHEDQLNFPHLYAVGREGVAGTQCELTNEHSLKITDSTDLSPLLDAIVEYIPHPLGDVHGPFQMQVTTLDADEHKGRYVIGRISRGKIKVNDPIAVVRGDTILAKGRCNYLYTFQNLKRYPLDQALAGDIVAIAGVSEAGIGDTLTDPAHPQSLGNLKIEEPTLKMGFFVNSSPFAGTEGEFSTSRQLRDRLFKELEKNIGLRVEEGYDDESLTVSGRGELHLAVLIENLRREGYEFAVSRPQVILKEIDGITMEPWERVTVNAPEEHLGVITTEIGKRKGNMINMATKQGHIELIFEATTRNIMGLRNRLLMQTAGLAIMHSTPIGYQETGQTMPSERNGALVAGETGVATTYGLHQAQNRGETFIEVGTQIYEGMIVGLNSRPQDLVINVNKEKHLTNVRSANSDIAVKLTPPRQLSLEQMIEFIEDDEILEVTPLNLRMRKKLLDERERRRGRNQNSI